jgi:hypothetical protein
MLALRADIQLIYKLIGVKDPELQTHLRDLCIDLSLISVESFLTIYTNTCHPDLTDVIMDHFMLEGPVVLLKTMVLLLGYMRTPLLQQESFGNHIF